MAFSPVTVHVAYGLTPELGKVYNELMEKAQTEWVLFLDHDLFICNPHWYRLTCLATQACEGAGLISAVCNRLAADRHNQLNLPSKDSDNLADHCSHAKWLYETFGHTFIAVPPSDPPFSGFYILTNKTAWKTVGGFKETGFLGVDDHYSGKIASFGFQRYIIPGLYFYHMRHHKKKLIGDWEWLGV